ncbi:MAG: glycosyltransferase [Elusimicrobia bacterium]|nr:glycosyltransferase [Elusimicrobiota bacterium]
MNKSLSIVIPAYNEENRVRPAIEAAFEWAGHAGFSVEVLISDDGSRDGTLLAARAEAARNGRVRALTGPHAGKGSAVRRGMLAATREAILFMDADQAAAPSEVQSLWPHLEAGADVVCGSRALPNSLILVPQPGSRSFAGRAARALVRLSGLTHVRDTQCGFKLFRAEAAKKIFSQTTIDGFAFDLEVLGLAKRLGLKVVEAPIRWSHQEPSHLSLKRDLFRIGVEVLRLAWRLR